MSDSWVGWDPVIDEPSKVRPASDSACPMDDTGTVEGCMMPGRSQKRTAIIATPSSLTYLSSSSLLLNIRPPWLLDTFVGVSRKPNQAGGTCRGDAAPEVCPHRRQGQFLDRIGFVSPM